MYGINTGFGNFANVRLCIFKFEDVNGNGVSELVRLLREEAKVL